jgi:hypothetical protein
MRTTLVKLIFIFLVLESCNTKTNNKNLSSKDSAEISSNESKERLNEYLNNEIITKGEIEKRSDEKLEQLIFTNIYDNIKVDLKSTNEHYRTEFEKFTKLQQNFYSTLVVERNTAAFGFKGYFEYYQSVGQFYKDAIIGYEKLGCTEISKTINEASKVYLKKPKNAEIEFKKLDTIFFDQIKIHKTNEARIKMVRQNIDSFVTQ